MSERLSERLCFPCAQARALRSLARWARKEARTCRSWAAVKGRTARMQELLEYEARSALKTARECERRVRALEGRKP